ncbi:MAG: AAA family ATPase [Chlamydiota bacterium]
MKKTSIGIVDYKELIENECIYVDKTLLIQEIVDRGTKLALIPRPRRFGKTINMSMLKYFFEKTEKDNSHLFSSYKIWQTGCRKEQGTYPVVFFTLEEVKQKTWELAYEKLKTVIADEFKRHRYLLDSPELFDDEKEIFRAILNLEANQVKMEMSLKWLTAWLQRHHDKNVIVLIDEYDAPIHMAYFQGYYPDIIDFMRNWLGGGLKDNASLERSVITGILRIAKENIFSDLNHGSNFTMFSEDFGNKFGLLEEEVFALLTDYDMGDKLEEVRKWYNGYHIGSYSVYNPWSILNYIQHKTLKPYWVNTSGNELIKEQLTQKGVFFKEDFETLILEGAITKLVDEGLVFTSLKKSKEAVWGLLLFSGYLTLASPPILDGILYSAELKIPNQEILALFQDMMREYFTETFSTSWTGLLDYLITGNVEAFSEEFQELILDVFSVHDIPKNAPERVYHAFVLGLLASLKGTYEIRSNKESGLGRYDVCLIPKNREKLGIILEFKKAKKEEKDLKALASSAIAQIETLHYVTELKSCGIKKILALGMAFQGKLVYIEDKFLS